LQFELKELKRRQEEEERHRQEEVHRHAPSSRDRPDSGPTGAIERADTGSVKSSKRSSS
jgi:hypothetical protein